MNDEELLQVCFNMRYLKKEPGEIIYTQGDIGD